MSLLGDLKAINNQKDNPVATARFKVSQYLHARFNQANYGIPLDNSTKRIYTVKARAQLTADFQKEHAEIIAAEEGGLLDKLDSISKFFEIQFNSLFKHYEMDKNKISEKEIQITTVNPFNSVIPQSPFEIIYQAAKQKDSAAIKEILNEVTIDVEIMLDGAPVSRLAAEGNIHAVDYLQKEFNASSRWAIFGYGCSVNIVEAQRLLSRAKTYNEFLHLLRQYVKGLAVCNNEDAKKELASRLENLSVSEKFDLNAPIVCGYIMGGHEAPKIILKNSGGLEPKEVIHAKISAWARTNRFDKVKEYINEKQVEAYDNSRNAYLDSMGPAQCTFNYESCIQHYFYSLARIGLLDEAMSRLNSFGYRATYYIWENQEAIILGLGRGGYHKKALDLINNNKFFQRYLHYPFPVSQVAIEQCRAQQNKVITRDQQLLWIELILGLAKGGAVEIINSLTLLASFRTYDLLKQRLFDAFLKKAYYHEAKKLLVTSPKGDEWYVLMRKIIDEMRYKETDLFQRAALEFAVGCMIYDGRILEDRHYPDKFDSLKTKAMSIVKIMHYRQLNFSQSMAWYDAEILKVMLQLSTASLFGPETLFMIFDFLHPMPRIEKQEVITKYYFQCKTSHTITALSTNDRLNSVISEWKDEPRFNRNGLTLFRMIKDDNLMRVATVSLKLETEEAPKAKKKLG